MARWPKLRQSGLRIARLCRTSTEPTEIRHQLSHSGGWSTFLGEALPPVAVLKNDMAPDEAAVVWPVRSAMNCVVSGVNTYALTYRNWTPINRTTKPMKKNWLRFSSMIYPASRRGSVRPSIGNAPTPGPVGREVPTLMHRETPAWHFSREWTIRIVWVVPCVTDCRMRIAQLSAAGLGRAALLAGPGRQRLFVHLLERAERCVLDQVTLVGPDQRCRELGMLRPVGHAELSHVDVRLGQARRILRHQVQTVVRRAAGESSWPRRAAWRLPPSRLETRGDVTSRNS